MGTWKVMSDCAKGVFDGWSITPEFYALPIHGIAPMKYWLGKSKVERDIYDASKFDKDYGGARDVFEYFPSTALDAGLVDDF